MGEQWFSFVRFLLRFLEVKSLADPGRKFVAEDYAVVSFVFSRF